MELIPTARGIYAGTFTEILRSAFMDATLGRHLKKPIMHESCGVAKHETTTNNSNHMSFKQKGSNLLGSLFLILLAIFIIAKTVREIRFYFDKRVVSVSSPADVGKLRDNVMTEVSLGLDFKRAYGVQYLSQREFFLIPFSDVGYRLMYAVEGPMSDNLVAKLRPPLKGRVVTKDFGDSWEVYEQRIKLQKILARDGIEIPADAMLIYDSPKELPSLWMFFLCALSLLYLAYKVSSIIRPARPAKTSEQNVETGTKQ